MFRTDREKIKEGDLVLLYGGREKVFPVVLKKGQTFNTKYGSFPHEYFIDKEFGSKVKSKPNKNNKDEGWIYVLRPTPELWTNGAITHRTQIIYTMDISYISFALDLKPGKIVVESGTGTGSLSTAIARTIAPNGHLYTFDFHAQRSEAAAKDFASNGVGDVITAGSRDVINTGFGLPDKIADAVFLDLPAPWECITKQFVSKVLKPNARFCAFSPCIEQVQQTCLALKGAKFADIQTVECLVRNMVVQVSNEVRDVPAVNNPNGRERKKQATESEQSKTEEDKVESKAPATKPTKTYTLFRPLPESRGHTSYLTFATSPPLPPVITPTPSSTSGDTSITEAVEAVNDQKVEGADNSEQDPPSKKLRTD